MKENEIYESLKKINLVDLINIASKSNTTNYNDNMDVYYTAQDLCKKYPNIFSKYKIDKYIKNESLPVIKNGKERLFLKSSVELWLKNKSKSQFNNWR